MKLDLDQSVIWPTGVQWFHLSATTAGKKSLIIQPLKDVTMKNASVLVLAGPSAKAKDLDPILQSAAAQRTHLSFLVLGPLPRQPVYGYGMAPYGMPVVSESLQEEIEAAKAQSVETADAIRKRLDESGTDGDVDVLGCDPLVLPSIVGQRAATCDVVLISQDLRADDV